MPESSRYEALVKLLEDNEKAVTYFYKLATAVLVLALLVHLAFSSWYLVKNNGIEDVGVWLFVVFNVTALVVEVFLSRIAFMLGARAGQLKDTRYAVELVAGDVDVEKFELAARALMSMRRDAGALKVVDIESIVERLVKGKPG